MKLHHAIGLTLEERKPETVGEVFFRRQHRRALKKITSGRGTRKDYAIYWAGEQMGLYTSDKG